MNKKQNSILNKFDNISAGIMVSSLTFLNLRAL